MQKAEIEFSKFDVADYLKSEEAILGYLSEAALYHDAAFFAKALGDVARIKGMSKIARKTGLSRESLYKALNNNGNPELATIMKVMSALDLSFCAIPKRNPT